MKPHHPLWDTLYIWRKNIHSCLRMESYVCFHRAREDWRKRRRSLFQNLQELKAKCQAQEWVGSFTFERADT